MLPWCSRCAAWFARHHRPSPSLTVRVAHAQIEDTRTLLAGFVAATKQHTRMRRERDALVGDLQRATASNEKLGSLCRELQKQNKDIAVRGRGWRVVAPPPPPPPCGEVCLRVRPAGGERACVDGGAAEAVRARLFAHMHPRSRWAVAALALRLELSEKFHSTIQDISVKLEQQQVERVAQQAENDECVCLPRERPPGADRTRAGFARS